MSAILPAIATHRHGIAGLLLAHARCKGSATALTFLHNGEEVERTFTYADLAARAATLARRLAADGLAGERALLLFHPGADFAVAFLACLMAGTVAVPMHPPATRRLLERARLVADDCRAAAAITTSEHAAQAAGLGGRLFVLDGLPEAGDCAPPALPDAHAPAFLQYTSGSTGDPKGVVVTQANLVANCNIIATAFAGGDDTVMVSWLPLLHDMGLIGSLIYPLWLGATAVHMSPQAMIRQPLRWMQAVHRFRGTLTGAPDFAWRLLCDKVPPEQFAKLDLSCLRVAYSGSEPVRASTIARVAGLLGGAGLRAGTLRPVYGLAETTLMATGGPFGAGVRQAAPETGGEPDMTYIGCGAPLPAGSLAVRDTASGARLPDGAVGEVLVTGDHVAAGYWGRDELTRERFRVRLPGDARDWLATGDLGFLDHGELFITGRSKDLIIVNGRKHQPEDVERSIQELVPGCDAGACAVFQDQRAESARLVAVVEMAARPADEAARAVLLSAAGRVVLARHEIPLDDIAAVRPGIIPRTTSGKVRRAEARELWRAGRLGGGEA